MMEKSYKNIACDTIFLLFLACNTSFAAPSSSSEPTTNTFFSELKDAFCGYYKILTSSSKSTQTQEGIFGALQRLRLEFKPKITKNIDLNLTYDHELFLNDFSGLSDFNLIRQKNLRSLSFFDTDQVITDTDHVYERQVLSRAYVKFQSPHSRVTFGKQLIDWGRMRFYSPLDIFNPPIPTDIEADERIGFDALNIELSSDNFSGINLVLGPGRTDDQNSYGLKFYKKIQTYDTFLIAVRHWEDTIAGLGFDGYIKDAGLRGEFTYTKSGKETYPRAALGIDYNFPHQVYCLLEYFYNGAANSDYNAFAGSLLEQIKRLSLKKNLLSFMASYKITPLLKASLSNIYDFDGKSDYLNPELRYNIKENLDVACGSQIFIKSAGSEFQGDNNVYYFELKYFF